MQGDARHGRAGRTGVGSRLTDRPAGGFLTPRGGPSIIVA